MRSALGSFVLVGSLSALVVPALSEAADCGDGVLDAGEECDDGNSIPGDCCGADCRHEDLDQDGWDCRFDCDDGNPDVHPLAVELPVDGIDNDCDGFESCYLDSDADSFGTDTSVASLDLDCDDSGEADDTDDCDDGNPAVHPLAVELPVDGIDNDCDGFESCYEDGDGDGVGSPYTVASADLDCSDSGESSTSDDCDDGDPEVFPGQPEVCDGIDNDCAAGPDDPGDALCDDGDACNGDELCGGAPGCVEGLPPDCLDGDGCCPTGCTGEDDADCPFEGRVALECDGLAACPGGVFVYRVTSDVPPDARLRLEIETVATAGVPTTLLSSELLGESVESVRQVRLPPGFPAVCPTEAQLEARLTDEQGELVAVDGCSLELVPLTP